MLTNEEGMLTDLQYAPGLGRSDHVVLNSVWHATLFSRGGGGAKNTFGFTWGACWIIVPYASVSGKTVFKFRLDVFSVGSQNSNTMCHGQKS